MKLHTAALTGASGKLGRYLLPLLAERQLSARCLVHRTPVEGDNVRVVHGSITDPDALDQLIAGADCVIHLATTKEDPETFFNTSIRGTFELLEACRRHPPKQFILCSGDAVQGIWFYPHPQPIDETQPLTAYPGYYAFSKVVEETMCRQYAIQYGLPLTILRSSWVFEADDLLHHFSLLENVDPAEPGHGFGEVGPELLAIRERNEERIPILTNAAGVPYHRHIVHIDDVMQGFGLALGNDSAVGEDFNLAAPAAFCYRVAANYLSGLTGLETVEVPCPGYHSFSINISKARSRLGYAPANDILTMCDRAVACRRGEEN